MTDEQTVLQTVSKALQNQLERPHGPAADPETVQVAGSACMRLCDGDHDKARSLWKLIVSDLGGEYMPQAAAVALIRASATENLVPDIPEPNLG